MNPVNSLVAILFVVATAGTALAQEPASTGTTSQTVLSRPETRIEYRLLATNKTSTMQKEMNEAADAGLRFGGVMGGDTSFGGSEVVVVMTRDANAETRSRFRYLLLATNKTSTMQKELQEAGDQGFEYKGQTVFDTSFGGDEVVVILERNLDAPTVHYEYRLLATKKTGTMQKELAEAGAAGFEFVGVTVGKTAFGGSEVVSILRRRLVE